MQSQTKYSGIKFPEVHGMRKNLDPNLRPEKQHAFPKQGKFGEAAYRSGASQTKEEET